MFLVKKRLADAQYLITNSRITSTEAVTNAHEKRFSEQVQNDKNSWSKNTFMKFQKHPLADVLQNRCS